MTKSERITYNNLIKSVREYGAVDKAKKTIIILTATYLNLQPSDLVLIQYLMKHKFKLFIGINE